MTYCFTIWKRRSTSKKQNILGGWKSYMSDLVNFLKPDFVNPRPGSLFNIPFSFLLLPSFLGCDCVLLPQDVQVNLVPRGHFLVWTKKLLILALQGHDLIAYPGFLKGETLNSRFLSISSYRCFHSLKGLQKNHQSFSEVK